VLIEDLLSTGGSAVASVEAIREEGQGIITDVVSIFSYELLSSFESAQSARVQLHPLSTITTLVEVAISQGRITEEDAERIGEFVKDPEGWGRMLTK
ncbi:MAG: orotate phosphoribosyltransferase, partial [Patescibacteria group bacterium]